MHIYCFYQTGAIVKYTDLLEQGSSESQVQSFLSDGDPTPITIRVPKNLKDAAFEAARLRGISFSACFSMYSSCFIAFCVVGCGAETGSESCA